MFRGLQLLRSVFWDTKAALALFVLDIPRLLLSIGDIAKVSIKLFNYNNIKKSEKILFHV